MRIVNSALPRQLIVHAPSEHQRCTHMKVPEVSIPYWIFSMEEIPGHPHGWLRYVLAKERPRGMEGKPESIAIPGAYLLLR